MFYATVDGVWKDWSAWSGCSVTCGGGYTNRSRICDGPYHNGKECDGNSTEVLICGTDPCPSEYKAKHFRTIKIGILSIPINTSVFLPSRTNIFALVFQLLNTF